MQNSNSKKLPYYEISGSYQEIGEFIGTTFGEHIREVIKKRKAEINNYEKYAKKSFESFELTRNSFPDLIAETEATAKSANVPIIDYFFINNQDVYNTTEGFDKLDIANTDHCTVVVGFDQGNPIVGHNEDWLKEAIDELYILKVKMKDFSYIGLNYNYELIGTGVTMNSDGLVQCINDLHRSEKIGVPKIYVARAILEAKSLEEAERIIHSVKRASGYNHVLVQNEEIRNIEIAGDLLGIERIHAKPYVHTNHYLTPELTKYEEFHTLSSERRYMMAKSFLQDNMKFEDVKGILSNRSDPEHPICRDDETIASSILLPKEKKCYFCYGTPDTGEFIEYTL